jgi:ABC-type nitrate/sulfonate/bicarbonate transport system substrate-binding protein
MTEPMRLALMWTLQSQFAGYVLAAGEELPELELVPREWGVSPIRKLLEGEAEYGVVAPVHLLTAGESARDLVLVALFMSRSPVRMIGLRERVGSELGPRQEKVRVGVWEGEDTELRAIARKAGWSPDQVDWVSVEDELGALMGGEVDYVQGTTYNELPKIVAAAGGEDAVVAHDPREWDVDVAKDGIAVRRDHLERNRDQVVRFIRGARAGWQRTLDDPHAAADRVCASAADLDPDWECRQIDLLVRLFDPEQPLGEPRQADVDRAGRAAQAAGVPGSAASVALDDGPWNEACA